MRAGFATSSFMFNRNGSYSRIGRFVNVLLAFILVSNSLFTTTVPTVAAAPSDACTPISTLPCGDVGVSLPFDLDWSDDEGGLDDGASIGTGFTMVDPPSTRLSVDNPVFDTDVPGYEPSKLMVNTAAGTLMITSTKGIMFSQLSGNPSSTETNSQINALGVGIDASSDVLRISTTTDSPNFASSGGNNSQQAGVWFGLNEDNYVKLAVAKTGGSTGKVQLFVEDFANNSSAPFSELNTDNISNIGSKIVKLTIEINPTAETVTGFYVLDGGSEQSLGSLPLSASLFAGVDHAPIAAPSRSATLVSSRPSAGQQRTNPLALCSRIS